MFFMIGSVEIVFKYVDVVILCPLKSILPRWQECEIKRTNQICQDLMTWITKNILFTVFKWYLYIH